MSDRSSALVPFEGEPEANDHSARVGDPPKPLPNWEVVRGDANVPSTVRWSARRRRAARSGSRRNTSASDRPTAHIMSICSKNALLNGLDGPAYVPPARCKIVRDAHGRRTTNSHRLDAWGRSDTRAAEITTARGPPLMAEDLGIGDRVSILVSPTTT